mgnify:CR=1 FL=1
MTSLAEKIAVMQAAERGEKIESKYIALQCPEAAWCPNSKPVWDWINFDYRVAPRTMEIMVVSWKGKPDYIFVITAFSALAQNNKEQLVVLSTQTITY